MGLVKRAAEGLVNKYIWHKISFVKKSRELLVSDSTLRDGEQTPGVSLLPDEKVRIAGLLAEMGVDSIDAAFAGAGGSEVEALKRITNYFGKSRDMPRVTSLCRAVESDIDAAFEGLRLAGVSKRGVSIFIGTSPEHMKFKFRDASKERIIDRAVKAICYARSKGFAMISFSPEDASRTEPEFLTEIYEAVIDAGAVNIGFTDTVGEMTPFETFFKINYIAENVFNFRKATFAIHFHNDLDLATANSLTAIETGKVDIFQGTIGGIGERSGNAPLESVVMALKLKPQIYGMTTRIDISKIGPTADEVYKLIGVEIPDTKPIIGRNIFRTEAGIHQAGLMAGPETYEIFPPSEVGRQGRELWIGKHSGRHAVYDCLAKNGYGGSQRIFDEFKEMAGRQKGVGERELLEIAEMQKGVGERELLEIVERG
ncbi:MAG: pyruvate carboxyltransferase [Nanoarchaeota archaeon]|nr:pyruvate carboxyltransferase [Nanoarchaeota archaeon]MBU1050997.1 pyruvate carboxyltransferase [Nanoarchaeota archaeon]MBU1988336.1 pyruvate carboxyltransferase [Nanoarchaeota archaeon]